MSNTQKPTVLPVSKAVKPIAVKVVSFTDVTNLVKFFLKHFPKCIPLHKKYLQTFNLVELGEIYYINSKGHLTNAFYDKEFTYVQTECIYYEGIPQDENFTPITIAEFELQKYVIKVYQVLDDEKSLSPLKLNDLKTEAYNLLKTLTNEL